MKNFNALILAAGSSERMGRPKFSLLFNTQITFLENIVNEYIRNGSLRVVVVLNENGNALVGSSFQKSVGVDVVVNMNPEYGRFHSVKCGLSCINNNLPVFIHNVDNPFVIPSVLEKLQFSLEKVEYSFPIYEGKGGHPVVVSSSIVKAIRQEEGLDVNLKLFLHRFKGQGIPVNEPRVIVNVNTPDDYERFLRFTF